jgi:uncharacterized protein (DUF433 family)
MSLSLPVESLPLSADADGVLRVGGTRVTLETVVAAFRDGLSAEGIVEQYPSLMLADVYSVIGYVLRHPEDVKTYLARRGADAAAVRAGNEAKFDPRGVRARLIARQGE